MVYTNKEMADMHFCYGLANGSSSEAVRLYRERFPNRQIPDRIFFEEIHRRLREDGGFAPVVEGTAPPPAGSLRNIEDAAIHRIAKRS